MKKMILVSSPVDKTVVQFTVVELALKRFNRGKCWTFYCQNPIWFIHLNIHGRADIGKCYCCVQLRAFEYFTKKLRERGRWVMPEKGKPVEWRFDQKKLEFSPA